MIQSGKKCQRDRDALAFFFQNPPHVPDMYCRIATLSDLPALLHLERYCFNPFLGFGRRRWRYLITGSACTTLLLFHQETLVAYLCLLPHQGWQGLEIRALAVHWSFRQKGLGRWLIQLSQALSRQWHMRALYLSVDCENTAALSLYQQAGFQTSAELADYYGPDRHGLRMRCHSIA
ncbi:GNAT family N-acetyltransferase [Tolumonas osonensis]|uniref:Ribosomal protein S18 acetylase RimI-like enzyme n=1 Tax=Tolumonas osonensis TaxID=675874 RepID=A0A841GA87_9GAMM|nr:N-acetyltransferase [Tolumonas osonensis]MBB6055968.1 ribosomal protein S18 acetylase RimI-like enzyme [Tolumonas osonensis]